MCRDCERALRRVDTTRRLDCDNFRKLHAAFQGLECGKRPLAQFNAVVVGVRDACRNGAQQLALALVSHTQDELANVAAYAVDVLQFIVATLNALLTAVHRGDLIMARQHVQTIRLAMQQLEMLKNDAAQLPVRPPRPQPLVVAPRAVKVLSVEPLQEALAAERVHQA